MILHFHIGHDSLNYILTGIKSDLADADVVVARNLIIEFATDRIPIMQKSEDEIKHTSDYSIGQWCGDSLIQTIGQHQQQCTNPTIFPEDVWAPDAKSISPLETAVDDRLGNVLLTQVCTPSLLANQYFLFVINLYSIIQ